MWISEGVKQQERYSQLTLVNSTAADTGEFSCWGQLCNGYICRRDEAKTGSTYIFFTEKGELFVPSPSYFDVVYLNPDRQAVVPCRVTVLSAKVTLHREFPAKEIPANGTDIVYDVKRGFVYLHPHSDHQGVVYCKAEAGGKSQISVKYQLLYVEVPSGPPSTTILASSNKVKGGDDISVLCTVLGEPDVEVEFRWIYPGQKDERPVRIQDTWRLIHRGLAHTTRISQSIMTVEDFETTDAGYYICTAQNLQGQTTVATTLKYIQKDLLAAMFGHLNGTEDSREQHKIYHVEGWMANLTLANDVENLEGEKKKGGRRFAFVAPEGGGRKGRRRDNGKEDSLNP
ncbi:hypothetical protein HPG69_009450 [Diceros bicornis minor]|uniref:Ig-like domain-containing protein n=1 Tax=Diceros bicornis minor TaxID=77932 RepID=A0A7J7F366_DICBM|nr:hypothetical protein HPG69_009450 [Diceros bicornis minor]